MSEWSLKTLLNKKRHDQANQLQLLLGYQQMNQREKAAEIMMNWMGQLERERLVLMLTLDKVSAVLTYYIADLPLTVDVESFHLHNAPTDWDESIALSVANAMRFFVKWSPLIDKLVVSLERLDIESVTLNYRCTLNHLNEKSDMMQAILAAFTLASEEDQQTLIIKNTLLVNSK